MSEYKKRKMGENPEVIAEYRLLNALVKNNEYIDNPDVNESLFISETAKSVYEAITSLHEEGVEITPASLYQKGYSIDYTVDDAVVEKIFNIDTEGASTLKDILDSLSNARAKGTLVRKLDYLKSKLEQPGTLDVDYVLGKLYELDEVVSSSGKSKSKLLNFSDWSDKYIQDLEQRKLGRKYSFGDPLLDEAIFKGASPGNITILTAATNSGKSTYVLNLIDSLLENNTPCMYISLEMGTIDTMDRLLAKRFGIENKELYNPENMDGLIAQVREEKENLSNRKNFFFCEATGVDMKKLRQLIREFKQKTKKDYCFIAIDLLSGMKDFMVGNNGASTASTIEVNMNRLEELAKEENVHILGVVQLNRESDNIKISHVEEIPKLRPTMSGIKNSSAFVEKATTTLACFRPKYYADRYCKSDPASETLEDIMEVQILKDRNAPAGRILKYVFDGKHFRLCPLVEEDKVDILKNLDIDY